MFFIYMSIFTNAVDINPSFFSCRFLVQYPTELTNLQRNHQNLFYLLYTTALQYI